MHTNNGFFLLKKTISWNEVARGRMKSKIIFVGLFFLVLNPIFAQYTISGLITSANEPVKSAEIILEPSTTVIKTNNKGEFHFENLKNGNYLISIFAEEHKEKFVSVAINGKDTTLVIAIQGHVINLQTVDIKAVEKPIADVGFLSDIHGTAIYAGKKSEVINVENEVANKATNNARQIYNHIAGLNIWESDGYGLQLGIGGRGLDPNRTNNFNTRQNGYDMSADNLGYPDAYYSPPAELLHKIEIVRGAAALQYGTQFGGMINFVLKKAKEDKPAEIVLRNTIGSFGFWNTTAMVSEHKDKVSYLIFTQKKEANGWRPYSDFKQYTNHVNIQYRATPKLTLSMEYTFMNYLAHQPGGLTDKQFETDPRQANRRRNWFQINWNMPAAIVDYRFSNNTYINSRTFGLIASRNALGNLTPISRIDDESQNRNLIIGEYNNIGNETRLLHKYDIGKRVRANLLVGARVFKGNTLSIQGAADNGLGANFDLLDSEPLTSNYNNPSLNVALFTENIFRLTKRFSLVPGVRYEYIKTVSEGFYYDPITDLAGNVIADAGGNENIQKTRNLVLFGLGATYRAKNNLEVYANASQNYKGINFSNLRIQNNNQLIDPNLHDEKGLSADIGIRKSGNVLRLDISAFYVRYFDRIGNLDTMQNRIFKRLKTNVDDANIVGLETMVEVDFAKLINDSSKHSFATFINAAWIEASYVGSKTKVVAGNRLEFVPKWNIKTGLKYGYKGFKVAYQTAFVSDQFTDATNGEVGFSPSYTTGKIPAYLVMDLSFSYAFKHYQIETGINNLANQMYFTRRAVAYPGPGIIPSDGRSFYLTLEVKI